MARNPAARVLRFSQEEGSDERLFASAFDHAPNGMAILNSDGRITHASLALCKLLGFSQAALLGLDWSGITHPDDVETEAQQRKRLASGEIERYQLLQRFLCDDGTPVWALLSVSAWRRVSGLPGYYVLQIESSAGHLSIGNDASPNAVEHLLGEAVHEIGNTLTPLMVNIQLIVERSTAGEICDSAHVIFNAARRIAFTLRRLRGLNAFQQGVAYMGESRMLDLRTVPPPAANGASSETEVERQLR